MSAPPAWWHHRSRAELLAIRDDIYTDAGLLLTDIAGGQIDRRIRAMEAVHAARWPRSLIERRRLARNLRDASRITEPPGGTIAFPPMRFSSKPPGRHR